MKFDFKNLTYDYANETKALVEKHTDNYVQSFLSTWKDKWVCLHDKYGWHYGKVINCRFGYFYYTNTVDMDLTVLLPNEEEVTFSEVVEVVEMSEKQKIFLDMKYLLMDYLAEPDINGYNEQIKDLLFQLTPCDIKDDEQTTN